LASFGEAENVKILISSAHTLLREGIALILRPLSPEATFVEACDSQEARHTAGSSRDIAVILVHVRLSTTEGQTALRELGRCCLGVPMLVISDTINEQDLVYAFQLGAWGYIGKTACGEDLLRAVRVILSGRPYVPRAWRDPENTPCPETAPISPAGAWHASTATKSSWITRLTARQLEVMDLLTEGLPNKAIARRLGLACGTVKCHVSAILRAMNATNRTQAVVSVGLGGVAGRPTNASDAVSRLH
jgi:DNA-binding NarL/FixJ family response regulator